MKKNKIINAQKIEFFNSLGNYFLESLWDEYYSGSVWQDVVFQAYDFNVEMGFSRRESWMSIYRNVIPIYKGMSFNPLTRELKENKYSAREIVGADLEELLKASFVFFERFKNKKIGVQLSGGLDSSIIIGLLKYFKIPHALIGLKSKRFEFRTECTIQDLLADSAHDVCFIDEETVLPYSMLTSCVPHQVPNISNLDILQDITMANAAKNLGVDVLLSGGGGDNLFGSPVAHQSENRLYTPQLFCNDFLVDCVYASKGISYVSFFSDPKIIDVISSLRSGQDEDLNKIWARQFFKDYLPRELVDFSFKADFWGRYIDGVTSNYSSIKKVCRMAYELSGDSFFSAERVSGLLSADLLVPNKKLYSQIEALTSSAVWVVSSLNTHLHKDHSSNGLSILDTLLYSPNET